MLCLAALVLVLTSGAGRTGGGGGGYVAVGGAGASADPGHAVPPDGRVTLVPLDGTPTTASSPGNASPSAGSAAARSGGASADTGSPRATTPPSTSGAPSTAPQAPGTPTASVSPSAPGRRPARLTVSGPRQAATDQRWCQDVTLTLTNSRDYPATSGTVTFATHIIGLLGIDWATIDTTENVPVPIAGGQRVEKTWQICVDAWRVPLGMHIETRSVTLQA
ncbi:hypothetical protein [Streptantibioticus ferralitis]|uniref:Secreted protein n=1 Tax=Streptantibioticus ferralitis TaxID=236510 RepID=A0ABT5Z0Y0_9ACTN|nr:hypothetical protein [Streptantibioticus ferralitis]MDF2257349.1 hypothetical protein [Streptantibioticus ferralitis]